MTKVDVSLFCIPDTKRSKRRPAANAAKVPTPTPRKIIPRLCRRMSCITSRVLAPSAMRTPISGTRWLVKYASTP